MNLIFLFLSIGLACASPRFDKTVDRNDLPLGLERHKRLYFIAGPENTKLQLSMKIPVIVGSSLYFAYTETGFWRLFQKDSNPFTDINHNPEVFYRWVIAKNNLLDLGIEHLSNGRDVNDSRSWNTVYTQGLSRFNENFYGTAKLFHIFDIDHTNENIYQYIGFLDLEFGANEIIKSKFQSNEFFVRWRPGGKFDFNERFDTVEIGLKVKFSDMKFFQHFFISYYNGYAENQLYYNKYTRALRAGLTF